MNLETVANENEVTKAIFKALSQKQRAIRITSLTNLYRAIHKTHPQVEEKAILDVFKKLEQAKLGNLVLGRKRNHNRFVWNYNLKDVAQLGTGKQIPLKPAPKGKRVRRIRKNYNFETIGGKEVKEPQKEQQETKSSTGSQQQIGPRFQFDIVLSPDVSAQDIKALVELVQSLQSK